MDLSEQDILYDLGCGDGRVVIQVPLHNSLHAYLNVISYFNRLVKLIVPMV